MLILLILGAVFLLTIELAPNWRAKQTEGFFWFALAVSLFVSYGSIVYLVISGATVSSPLVGIFITLFLIIAPAFCGYHMLAMTKECMGKSATKNAKKDAELLRQLYVERIERMYKK